MPNDRAFARAVGVATFALGLIAAWLYARADLTLSHYDAKAHLVVARRVIDSIMPGWQQIGAVWLPLPHLLNLIPVQVDAFYRTGASAVALSVAAHGVAGYATARLILRATGSRLAAVAGTAVLAMNPNLLYLQATPMTEPLLLALLFLAVMFLHEWLASGASRVPAPIGWTLAAACLTRYEAWPVTAAALAGTAYALARRGRPFGETARLVARIAAYPVAAIGVFVLHSRITIGAWFVSGGFFVPDNPAMGRPLAAAIQVWWGTHELSGYGIATLGAVGAVTMLALGLSARRAELLVIVALVASAALPAYAFLDGHPFRIRYMAPVTAAAAVCAGVGVGLARRWQVPSALALLAVAASELRPLDRSAPMIVEAQLDRENRLGRFGVTRCLRERKPGEKIMASMGSLAHYMQELSHEGLAICDFLHEGNGEIWLAALDDPRPHVRWVLIEEQAEGGDMLARRRRGERRRLLEGYTRVCEGGGVALYKRDGQ